MPRSGTVRFRGALGSENVGMSNRNAGEIPAHRKPKVSATMVISRGLGGPKAKPRGAVDGHSVNIPILPFFAARVTKFSNLGRLLDSCWRFEFRAARRGNRAVEMFRFGGINSNQQTSRKNLSRAIKKRKPYRKPTQVGWLNSAKVNG